MPPYEDPDTGDAAAYADLPAAIGQAYDTAVLATTAVYEDAEEGYPPALVDDLSEEFEAIAEEHLGNVRDVDEQHRSWQGYDLMNTFITAPDDDAAAAWERVEDWVSDAVTAHYGADGGVQAPGMEEPVSTAEYADMVQRHTFRELVGRRHAYRQGMPATEVRLGDDDAESVDELPSPA